MLPEINPSTNWRLAGDKKRLCLVAIQRLYLPTLQSKYDSINEIFESFVDVKAIKEKQKLEEEFRLKEQALDDTEAQRQEAFAQKETAFEQQQEIFTTTKKGLVDTVTSEVFEQQPKVAPLSPEDIPLYDKLYSLLQHARTAVEMNTLPEADRRYFSLNFSEQQFRRLQQRIAAQPGNHEDKELFDKFLWGWRDMVSTHNGSGWFQGFSMFFNNRLSQDHRDRLRYHYRLVLAYFRIRYNLLNLLPQNTPASEHDISLIEQIRDQIYQKLIYHLVGQPTFRNELTDTNIKRFIATRLGVIKVGNTYEERYSRASIVARARVEDITTKNRLKQAEEENSRLQEALSQKDATIAHEKEERRLDRQVAEDYQRSTAEIIKTGFFAVKPSTLAGQRLLVPLHQDGHVLWSALALNYVLKELNDHDCQSGMALCDQMVGALSDGLLGEQDPYFAEPYRRITAIFNDIRRQYPNITVPQGITQPVDIASYSETFNMRTRPISQFDIAFAAHYFNLRICVFSSAEDRAPQVYGTGTSIVNLMQADGRYDLLVVLKKEIDALDDIYKQPQHRHFLEQAVGDPEKLISGKSAIRNGQAMVPAQLPQTPQATAEKQDELTFEDVVALPMI